MELEIEANKSQEISLWSPKPWKNRGFNISPKNMDEVNPKTWRKNRGFPSSLVYVFSSSSKALWSSNLSWTRFREFSHQFSNEEILKQQLKPIKMGGLKTEVAQKTQVQDGAEKPVTSRGP